VAIPQRWGVAALCSAQIAILLAWIGAAVPVVGDECRSPPVHFTLLPSFYAPVAGFADRQAFALADVSRDHVLDLIVADQFHLTVDIYLGSGDGTFTFVRSLDAPVDARAIAVADLSSPSEAGLRGAPDGNPDILVGGGNAIWLYFGRADGSFPSRDDLAYVSEADHVIGFALGDFNRDGRTDVAVGDSYRAKGVEFLCYSAGVFKRCDPNTSFIQTASAMRSIVGGDFNGDGAFDVATLSYEGKLTLLAGSGDGRFAAVATPSVQGAGGNPFEFVSTYGAGRAKDDLVVANYETFPAPLGYQLGVTLSGQPDGTFCTSTFALELETNNIALADFTGDGVLDAMATTRQFCPRPPLTLSVGTGSNPCDAAGSGFTNEICQPGGITTSICPDLDPDALAIAAADLGGDALPDFIVIDLPGRTMRVGINDTQTAFVPTPRPFDPCVGDCRQPGVVGIADLVTGVQIALGTLPASACPNLRNPGCRVDIGQLTLAVDNALNGCVPAVAACR
jgi:hypothetical protein